MPPLPKPFVEITEQPHPKAIRFRYLCEGRSAGSIPGVNTTTDNKTFPTIRVQGYRGRAVVVVSCVTIDGPNHKPHPHNLVGKDCKKGVCTVEMNSTTMSYSFNNLGIQCVKKKEVAEALKQRLDIRVDPFRTGFNHATEASSIDLNAVRLCFQVFLEGKTTGRFTEPLTPVVSDVIYDKKAMSDLTICRLSDCSAPVSGGKNIIMLCEKVVKEDIRVRFYEMQNNVLIWEGNGEFSHTDVHKQVAISFRTPQYRTLEITEPVTVFVRLERPSDSACSESLDFMLTPLDSAFDHRRKRPKVGGPAAGFTGGKMQSTHGTGTAMGRQFKHNDMDDSAVPGPSGMTTHGMFFTNNPNTLYPTQMPKQEIKPEPGDSPQPYNNTLPGMHQMPQHTSPVPDRSPSHLAPSPGMQGGPISPHDAGSITPSPPVLTQLQTPMNQQFYQSTMAPMASRNQPQQQFQNNNSITQGGGTIPGTATLYEPSLMQAWEQNGLDGLHVGNFDMINSEASLGMLPASLIMPGIGGSLNHGNNQQSNSAIPSMNSELNFNRLSEFDFERLPEINSSEIRAILVPNSSLPVSQGLQQQQQQQQHQQLQQEYQQMQQQLQQHDNDEELTDSFNRLSTND
uniref:Putative transcription factor p65 n=1 Tax=Anopheles triannulatus TaxID=58253 RepID=A0A2M4ACM6_9DIPT